MIYLPTCTIKTNHNQIYKYTIHGAYGICFYSSPGVFAIFPPYIINKSTVGPARVEEFACAVNAETLAEMVGSAATWLSSAVSTCVLAFQDLFWALGKQLGPHQTGVQWTRHFLKLKSWSFGWFRMVFSSSNISASRLVKTVLSPQSVVGRVPSNFMQFLFSCFFWIGNKRGVRFGSFGPQHRQKKAWNPGLCKVTNGVTLEPL